MTINAAATAARSIPSDDRRARILAKSVYRDLRQAGMTEREVMAFTSELLALVTADVRSRDAVK